MKIRLLLAAALGAAFLSCPALAQGVIAPGHVIGNGTSSFRTATDSPLINVMNQSGSGLGTGVAGALATAIGNAGAPILFNGAAGTPSSINLTHATGLPASACPLPTATTVGCVESIASLAHNFVAYIDTSGVPHQAQPSASDISGLGTFATQNYATPPAIGGTTPAAGSFSALTDTALGVAGLVTNTSGGALGTSPVGTGVASALGTNVGTAGSVVINSGALGTPSSGVATNLTGTAAGLTAGSANAAPAGALTGGTLASGVTASSLLTAGSPFAAGSSLYPTPSAGNQFHYNLTSRGIANTYGASNFVGGTPALDASTTWANAYLGGVDAYGNATFYGLNQNGWYGGAFGTRTSDNTEPTQHSVIAESAIVEHDNTSVNHQTWARYTVSVIPPGALNSWAVGEESSFFNQSGANGPSIDPFTISGSLYANLWLDGGVGGISPGTFYDISAAIGIALSGSKYESGIVIQDGALDTSVNGNPDAIALPYYDAITHYASSGQKSWLEFGESGVNGNLDFQTLGSGALQVIGSTGNFATSQVSSYANIPLFTTERADGTRAALAAVTFGETTSEYLSKAYDGSAYGNGAAISTFAAENWASGHHGMALNFNTTPTSSTSLALALRINASGGIGIGASATDPGINNLQVQGNYQTASGHLFVSSTAPTFTSGACVGAIGTTNGSAAFTFTTGTGSCGSTATIGMPTANAGWVCDAIDEAEAGIARIQQTSHTTTSVVLTNYSIAASPVAANFTVSHTVLVKCAAY